MPAELLAVDRALLDGQNGRLECLDAGGRYERSVDPIADDLGRTPRIQRHDRGAGGERLDADDPEVVLTREDQPACGAKERPDRLVVDATGECHVVLGAAL